MKIPAEVFGAVAEDGSTLGDFLDGFGGDFVVMCRVSGGVTGTREAELKKDGQIQYFATAEEAQAKADELNARPRSPYSTADFRYWVERA